MVNSIFTSVSSTFASNPQPITQPTYPCSTPHTLSFQIAGQQFPVDPRDFIVQNTLGDATTCVADNLASTDAPSNGTLFSWSLGDPFLKSNLVAFYYGNLTHPSVDPPRIGFLSLVPQNASQLLQVAVGEAVQNDGTFECESLRIRCRRSAGLMSGSATSHNAPTATNIITVPPPATATASLSLVNSPDSAVNDKVASVSGSAASGTPTHRSGAILHLMDSRTASAVIMAYMISYFL